MPFAAAAATGAVAMSTATTAAMSFAVTVSATAAVAVPFTVLIAVTATATAWLLFALGFRVEFGGNQFAVFKLGNRLRDNLRIGSVHRDALRHQHAQGYAVDGATEHGIHADALVRFVFVCLQRNVLVLTRFGVKEKEGVGLMQIRLNRRLDALILGDRNA